MFLDSGRWNEWQKFENLFSLDCQNKMNFTIKWVCYVHSPLPMGKIWAHIARVYRKNSDFCVSVFFSISMALQITVLIFKSGHMDPYYTQR